MGVGIQLSPNNFNTPFTPDEDIFIPRHILEVSFECPYLIVTSMDRGTSVVSGMALRMRKKSYQEVGEK